MKKNYKFRYWRCAFAICLGILLLTSGMISVSGEEKEQAETAEPTSVTQQVKTTPDFTYEIENGEVIITGYTDTEPHVVIPSEIDSMPVTAIGKDAFYSNLYITDVIIPQGVKAIKSGAFFGCENLMDIEIPESVTVIEKNAFTDCSSLEKITIPDGVTKIEPWTFSGCTNLSTINIPDSLSQICCDLEDTAYFNNADNWENDMLYLGEHLVAVKKDIEHAVLRADTKSITNAVFAECKNLTDIEVTSNIEVIGICTFDGCTNLEEIIIPEGIKTIDKAAFQRCENLTKVTIPESVDTIEDNAFLECTNLSGVYIPKNVSFIGSTAFSNCPNLTIYGINGSYAEKYCEENNLKFIGENLIIICDYNNDNMVDIDDATLLQQALSMMIKLDNLNIASYDFNGDGEFNVADVTEIQLLIAV